MNQSWQIISNFHHKKGDHCESTSLNNVLNYLGFSFSEAFTFGLDATIGFSYWNTDILKIYSGKFMSWKKNSFI